MLFHGFLRVFTLFNPNKMKPILLVAFLALFTSGLAQNNPDWQKWNWLIGDWKGEGIGTPGQGGGVFTFYPDLDKKILIRKSHTEFPVEENRPQFFHDDLMVIYPDNLGNISNAIYFDNEGHTLNYLIAYTDSSIVLTSTKILDAPVFRLTYTRLNAESVNIKFEMSKDGISFFTYLEGKSLKTK